MLIETTNSTFDIDEPLVLKLAWMTIPIINNLDQELQLQKLKPAVEANYLPGDKFSCLDGTRRELLKL